MSFFTILSPVYGEDIDLRLRFKRREPSRSHVARFVPPRLKLSANSEGGQVSGYLRKKQRGLKWKRSWFVLKDRVLYTYKASEDTVATDTLPVLGWSISLLDKVRFSNAFILLSSTFLSSEGLGSSRRDLISKHLQADPPGQPPTLLCCRQ